MAGGNQSEHEILVYGPLSEGERLANGKRVHLPGWMWTCTCGESRFGLASGAEADDNATAHLWLTPTRGDIVSDDVQGGVVCGQCESGDVYFLTCGIDGCEWATGFECRGCGALHPIDHTHDEGDHPGRGQTDE